VERDGATHYVPVEAIVMVQANAHYTSVFDGQTHSFCSLSIGEVESRLDPARFLRVHRSYIVAIDRIASLRRSGDGGMAQLDSAEPATAPVSRGRYTTLKRRMEANA
jgi:DNA-binding LytR/AlgR family response regulator